MGDYIVVRLIPIGIFFISIIWGSWELIDYFFIDEVIKSDVIIIPEIKLIVKDNIVDTIYIYRQK
jgi:hypothetical protein